jgi:hypothetical protein
MQRNLQHQRLNALPIRRERASPRQRSIANYARIERIEETFTNTE